MAERVAKANEKAGRYFQMGAVALIQKLLAHNDKVYEGDCKKAKDYNTVGGDVVQVLTSDCIDIDEPTRMEMVNEANEKYKAALERTLESIKNTLGRTSLDVTEGLTKKTGTEIFTQLGSADDYVKKDDNGYIDINASKAWIVKLRGIFTGYINLGRVIIATKAQKESLHKVICEVYSGEDAGSTKMKGAETAVEGKAAHLTMLFDRLASTTLRIQKKHNQIRYINKQIEKWHDSLPAMIASVFFTFCAIGLGILAIFVPPVAFGAIAFSSLAAVMRWGAADIADNVDDEYKPSQPDQSIDLRNSKDKNKSMTDISEAYSDRAEELMGEIGYDQLDKVGDGYLQINYSEIAGLNKRLLGIQNMLRVITMIQRKRAAKRRLLMRAYTGLRAGSDSPLIGGGLNASLAQMGVKFQSLASYLVEIQEAHNHERAQEIAMEKATFQLGISLCAGFIGAGMGGAAGFALGQAIGSALAGYINARWGPWFNGGTSYGVSFDPDVSTVREDGPRRKPKDLAEYADLKRNEIYSEMLDFSQTIISAGDGRVGVNVDRASALQKQLQAVNNMILLLAATQETRGKAQSLIGRAYGMLTDTPQGVSNLARAITEVNLNNFSHIQRLLGEKVAVQNRAAQAADEVKAAAWKLAISVAVGLPLALIPGLAGLALPAVNFANAIFDMIYNIDKSDEGYGGFDDYARDDSAKNHKTERSEETNKAIQLAESLDEWQAEALSLDRGSIADIGDGNWGLNMGTVSQTQLTLAKINRIAEILVSTQKQRSEIQAKLLGGSSLYSSSTFEASLANAQKTAFSLLETQIQALQTVVGRHNEMNAAERAAWQAGVQALFVAASTVFSEIIDSLKEDWNTATENINNGKENLEGHDREILRDNPSKIKTYTWLSLTSNMLGIISDWAVGAGYDARQDDASIDKSASEEKVQRKEAAEKRAETFAEKMDAMEQTTYALKADAANTALQTQGIEYSRRAADQLLKMISDLIKGGVDGFKSLYATDRLKDVSASYLSFDKLKKDLFNMLINIQSIAGLIEAVQNMLKALAALENTPKEFKNDDPQNSEARSRAQLEYANRIEKQMVQIHDAAKQLQTAADQIKALEEQTKKVRESRDSIRNVKSKSKAS
ncbi:MAG: hypothetical protein V3T21_00870, partial [Candidatus Margulisiibacteriota bacterium]